MGVTASVVGASGYAGGELLRLLAAHPHIDVGAVAAGSNAGRPLTELHPQLVSLAGHTLTTADDPAVGASDLVFLALPHGESAAVARTLPPHALVVDLGADFRLADGADWQRWYGAGAPHAGTWTYGLPELPGTRAAISTSRRIANPGCYATAITLALAPLLAAGYADSTDIVVVAASGTSGAGRAPAARLLGSEVMGDMTPYKVGGTHQHLPEMRQSLGALIDGDVTMSFTPLLAPMPRGILATCTARARAGVTLPAVRAAFAAAYDAEQFVTLLPDGQLPHTAATAGSNSCHLQVALDADAGRVIVMAAIDNLGKGAAGQAVQNANLALGLPESAGLSADGIAP